MIDRVHALMTSALLCAGIGMASPTTADESGSLDMARVSADTVETILRPAHARFAEQASELARMSETLCTSPPADPTTLSAAWQDTVASFSAIEFLRIGPLLEDNRLNRLFYWPDKRRAGERQLRALLTSPVEQITADSMAARSVAVQGLPALERLLFPNGEVADSAARCAAAGAVAGHVAGIADILDRAWQSDDGIVRQMRDPRADDELLRSQQEVLRRIATQSSTGLDILIERKLAPVLDGDTARLRGLPFVRSGALLAHLGGNIASLQALMLDSGLAHAAELDEELGFEFRIARGHLQRLATLMPAAPMAVSGEAASAAADGPRTLDAEQAGVVRALHSVMSSVRDTLRERLLPTLGIRTGFNSEDGD